MRRKVEKNIKRKESEEERIGDGKKRREELGKEEATEGREEGPQVRRTRR